MYGYLSQKKTFFFWFKKICQNSSFGINFGTPKLTKNHFFHFFWGPRFEDTFGIDFWANLAQFRKVRPSIHSPWRSRNACQAFLWKACESCKFDWKKTSKKALKTTKINKKGLLKTSHFWIPFFCTFLWILGMWDLGVGDLFGQKNDFFPCFFRSSNFVSMLNDFGLHFDHLGEDLGWFWGTFVGDIR